MGMISKENKKRIETPREPLDPDMVYITGLHLKNIISDKAANEFLNDPYIKDVANKSTNMQRVIINKYFTNKLLMFRANSDVDVTSMLSLLINDGVTEDWFSLFSNIVAPFIKKHNIM